MSVITMSVPSTAPASLGANVTANFVLPPGSTASGSSSIALGWNDETSVVTDGDRERLARASVLNTVTSASERLARRRLGKPQLQRVNGNPGGPVRPGLDRRFRAVTPPRLLVEPPLDLLQRPAAELVIVHSAPQLRVRRGLRLKCK